MLDYYQILGVPQSATQETIKLAYKKLAFKHHPDRNSGDLKAEEYFKLINEAYQTLSNADKKSKYDFQIYYNQQTQKIYRNPAPPYQNKDKTVYNRYGKYDWRNAPKYKTAPVYKIDKNYFKNQFLALIAMLIVSGLIFGLSFINTYLDKKEAERIDFINTENILKAQKLYDNGYYREALNLIVNLEKENPIENRFFAEKDEMISKLNVLAIDQFKKRSYLSAADKLEVLKEFQKPMRLNTWQLLANCYMELEEFKKAVHAFDYILIRDQENIDLILKIAQIYQNQLGNKEKALDYYNEARFQFKKLQSSVYGDAFEFIINPIDLPEAYFEMFKIRAELMMKENNYNEVIKDCNWAIFLRPDRPEMYYLRAKAKFALDEKDRACLDIKRALSRGYSRNSIKIKIKCD
jgi:curved DNA-binding protein CbpA